MVIEKFIDSLEEFARALAIGIFIWFIVLPVILVCFLISVVFTLQAVQRYLMIENETYQRKGWSFTQATVTETDDGTLQLCWSAGQCSYNRVFRGFTYDDTMPVLYRTQKPQKYIRCDKEYWRDKIRKRFIVSAVFAGMFFLLLPLPLI